MPKMPNSDLNLRFYYFFGRGGLTENLNTLKTIDDPHSIEKRTLKVVYLDPNSDVKRHNVDLVFRGAVLASHLRGDGLFFVAAQPNKSHSAQPNYYVFEANPSLFFAEKINYEVSVFNPCRDIKTSCARTGGRFVIG